MIPEFSMFYKKISRHFLKVHVKLRGNFDQGCIGFVAFEKGAIFVWKSCTQVAFIVLHGKDNKTAALSSFVNKYAHFQSLIVKKVCE